MRVLGPPASQPRSCNFMQLSYIIPFDPLGHGRGFDLDKQFRKSKVCHAQNCAGGLSYRLNIQWPCGRSGMSMFKRSHSILQKGGRIAWVRNMTQNTAMSLRVTRW